MHKAWDPQHPVETLFKQIQDCVDYAEKGGIHIGEAHKLITAYTKVFSTDIFHSTHCRWNERAAPDKAWDNFKIHFTTVYHQHNHMQGQSAINSGCANADVSQPEDDLSEAANDEFSNLSTATVVELVIEATFTDAQSCLAKQL
jgi:hypothetical protein